jgi:hypothetical protein
VQGAPTAAPATAVTVASPPDPEPPDCSAEASRAHEEAAQGATGQDFQRALNAYAAQSGQTYQVDASDVDLATAGKSEFSSAAEPDVPDIFSYLTVRTVP